MERELIGELKYLLYAGFVYLNIDMNVFFILIIFMGIDTVTGVIKTFRLNYRSFTFGILLWGIVSKLGILIIPLLVALLSKGIGQDMIFGVTLIVKILIVSEFISSLGNCYTIKTKKIVKDIDIFTMLFNFIRSQAFGILKKYTKVDVGQKKEENEN